MNQAKQLLSPNQIYDHSKTTESFSSWIDKENADYNARKESGRIWNMSFVNWLNQKYAMKFKYQANADGTIIGDIFSKTTEKLFPSDKEETTTTTGKKYILGLKPGVFYLLTGLTILAIGYGIYSYYNKKTE